MEPGGEAGSSIVKGVGMMGQKSLAGDTRGEEREVAAGSWGRTCQPLSLRLPAWGLQGVLSWGGVGGGKKRMRWGYLPCPA